MAVALKLNILFIGMMIQIKLKFLHRKIYVLFEMPFLKYKNKTCCTICFPLHPNSC